MGFLIKWIGVIGLAFLVYCLMCRAGIGLITFNLAGLTLSVAGICGWAVFFMGAGVNVKS